MSRARFACRERRRRRQLDQLGERRKINKYANNAGERASGRPPQQQQVGASERRQIYDVISVSQKRASGAHGRPSGSTATTTSGEWPPDAGALISKTTGWLAGWLALSRLASEYRPSPSCLVYFRRLDCERASRLCACASVCARVPASARAQTGPPEAPAVRRSARTTFGPAPNANLGGAARPLAPLEPLPGRRLLLAGEFKSLAGERAEPREG